MIPHIVVYTRNPPTDKESDLVRKFASNNLLTMVDSNHTDKQWFLENFRGVHHRMGYIIDYPNLLVGQVEEIDWSIMARPHFSIYYSTSLENAKGPDAYDWECIVKYLTFLLLGIEEDMSDIQYEHAKRFMRTSKQTLAEPAPEAVEATEGLGEFVIERSLEDYYYKFESKFIKEADLMFYQVTKPFVERPFTVLVDHFSTTGPGRLFTDLFACPDWGRGYTDIQFLDSLWTHLGLLDDAPFDIEKMLKAATEACLPNESGEILSEPRVYRKTIGEMERLEGKKFG